MKSDAGATSLFSRTDSSCSTSCLSPVRGDRVEELELALVNLELKDVEGLGLKVWSLGALEFGVRVLGFKSAECFLRGYTGYLGYRRDIGMHKDVHIYVYIYIHRHIQYKVTLGHRLSNE